MRRVYGSVVRGVVVHNTAMATGGGVEDVAVAPAVVAAVAVVALLALRRRRRDALLATLPVKVQLQRHPAVSTSNGTSAQHRVRVC